METLFVYGTLKRGRSASLDRWKTPDGEAAEFIGKAVVPNFKMYNKGFPACVRGSDSKVFGELWKVPKGLWKRLDTYEGVPHLFIREQVLTEDKTPCWMYVYNSSFNLENNLIPSGEW